MSRHTGPRAVADHKQAQPAAKAIVYRRRLRAKTGCNRCRERRKKCDEQKPICGDCQRLSYPCSWNRPSKKPTNMQLQQCITDRTTRNRIIETYHVHRDEMIIMPPVESMIQHWIESSEKGSQQDSSQSPCPSDVESSSPDTSGESSPSPSSPLQESFNDFASMSIEPGIGESSNSDKDNGYIYEATAPIWRHLFADFKVVDPSESLEDQHIAISIVLHGWHHTKRCCKLSDMWIAFEKLYEPLGLDKLPQVERLAVVNLHWRLAKIEASHSFDSAVRAGLLPPHFETRPLNRYLPNPRAPTIKFFPWPGVREHMALRPLRYRKDHFIKSLYSEFRFLFPAIGKAYYVDPYTGQYAFSKQFLDKRDDLSAWTVTSDFFASFPEFIDDIALFNPDPDAMQLTSVGSCVSACGQASYNDTRPRFESFSPNGLNGSAEYLFVPLESNEYDLDDLDVLALLEDIY